MARVGYGVSFGVGQEALETDINTQMRARWNMLDFALGLHAELAMVAIGTTDDMHPLDILHWKGLNLLFLVSYQAESPNAAAISEGDVPAIIVKLPSCLLVLNRSVIVLKLGIALLSRPVLSAVLIEPRDSKPRPIRTCLTSLGVEPGGKGILFGKDSAIGLQVVFGDMIAVHPQAHTLIANELDNAYRFFNGGKLLLIAIQFVLVDQHGPCSLLSDRLQLYIIIMLHVQKAEHNWPTNESLP